MQKRNDNPERGDPNSEHAMFAPTRAVLAWVYDMSVRQIDRLLHEHGAPSKTKDGFNLSLWDEFLDTYRRRTRQQTSGDGQNGESIESIESGRRRFELARARRAEIELAKLEGELVERAEMEQACVLRSGYFVSVLKQIPARAGPRVAGKSAAQATKILREVCRGLQRANFGERES